MHDDCQTVPNVKTHRTKGAFLESATPGGPDFSGRCEEGDKLKMKAPENKAPATHPIALGSSFRELDEDEAARPFAFKAW